MYNLFKNLETNGEKALRIIKNKHNISVNQFSSDIVKSFFTFARDIIEENGKDNIVYQKIYKDWKETIKLFNEYHQYSDNEYMKLRLKNI